MERWLGRFTELFYAALRIVAGALFACHGAQKLFGVFGEKATTPLMVAGGIIELVGGTLIAVGLITGFAAFVSSGQMAFAYFNFHAHGSFWPIQNHGELAVLYCFVFLFMAARGSGPISLDAALGRGGRKRR